LPGSLKKVFVGLEENGNKYGHGEKVKREKMRTDVLECVWPTIR
jgi:hypothetical protein